MSKKAWLFGVLFSLLLALAVASVFAATPVAQAILTWQDNSNNEDGFTIERMLNNEAWTVLVKAVGANVVSFTDGAVVAPTAVGAPDNVYCYRVLAFNAAGPSAYTNQACKTFAAPVLQPPAAPSNLTITFENFTGEIKISGVGGVGLNTAILPQNAR